MRPMSVAVRRGALVESRHRVHAVAVTGGAVVDAAGDPDLVTFLRSAAKPFQALPLVRAVPDLGDEEIAIACASHGAGEDQLAAVRSLLARAEAGEGDLDCGPYAGSRLKHNCSGKHAAMLVVARARGWPREGYRLRDHPVQREHVRVVADAADVAVDELETATDGCGVLTFAMSLRAMAHMFSRLILGELEGSGAIVAGVRARRELLEGPAGGVDVEVMRRREGSVAKAGAEGLLCVGLPDGTGVALKVEDGTRRAVAPAAGRFLEVPDLIETAVLNSLGERVGTIAADF